FGQTDRGIIGYNDTAGNNATSTEFSFVVIDSYTPDVDVTPTQTTDTPEYNGTNTIAITLSEAVDASGLDMVWLNYTTNNWASFTVVNITFTPIQSYIFTAAMLEYGQVYKWFIGYNDTVGNTATTNEFTFTVNDPYAPDVDVTPSQTTTAPEFNETNSVSITVSEPSDAVGLGMVWLNYTITEWLNFSVIDVTATQNYTFTAEMLEVGQVYRWFIGYNDSLGNTATTLVFSFRVQDTASPNVIEDPTQSTNTPEYNETVVVSIRVEEDPDAEGLDTVWLNYTTTDWVTFEVINITSTQNYTFSADTLSYGQIYQWIIGFNDTAGNTGYTIDFSFTVEDHHTPDVMVEPNQTTNIPEYNDTNTISIFLSEPSDASGLHSVWLNYTTTSWSTFSVVNISENQNFTFLAEMLEYGQVYRWIIGYNDTVGNTGYTDELSFTVQDPYAPDVESAPNQITDTPEYNNTNTISITLSEAADASGLHKIWLNYTTTNWMTFSVLDITATQNYTFTAAMLVFGQTYKWIIGYNDTAGNTAFSNEKSFIVSDTYAPDVNREAEQTTSTPEYNGTITVLIDVSEPIDASGIAMIWLNYTTSNWAIFSVVEITATQNYSFTAEMLTYAQTFQWVIGYNDTVGNTAFSDENSFRITDNYSPDVNRGAEQTTPAPEYNGTITVSIGVSEPLDASGIAFVWLNYTTSNWVNFSTVNITSTQNYTFIATMLEYGQTYRWIIGYNDTVGNTGYTDEFSFTVQDLYAPDVESAPNQTTNTPEYNGTNSVAITVYEMTDASGLHTVWLNYTTSNWESFSVIDITATQNYTFSADLLIYGQVYRWIIGYNDTAGNIAYSSEKTFTVTDTYAPDVNTETERDVQTPDYNDTVTIATNISEAADASGLHTIWLNFTSTNWMTFSVVDITVTQNYTFTADMLIYEETYQWVIGYNDTAGNVAYSSEMSFTVNDTYVPVVNSTPEQTTPMPEYNGTNTVLIGISEPNDASGIDLVWLNYTTSNWVTFSIVDITSTQSYTFIAAMLEYGQIYRWFIGYNDTVGNTGYTDELSFTVQDHYAPDVAVAPNQTTNTLEYNDTNAISISLNEPVDASNLHKVWLNYTSTNWRSFSVIDITATQNYIFTANLLSYGQTIQWLIGYNDTAGNAAYSNEKSFVVIDTYAPDINREAEQTTQTPEFNGTVVVSIGVSEPIDASGVDMVWLNYTLTNWSSFSVVNITGIQNYTFTEDMLDYGEIYHWFIGYNDTAGNTAKSREFSFTVVDSYAPDIKVAAYQTTTAPEFNDTVTVMINVKESLDAAGLETVWLNYTSTNWNTYVIVEITSTQRYDFSDAMLRYGQVYQWIIGYNDTAGNNATTSEYSFTVVDSYAPMYRNLSQTNETLEYDDKNTISVTVIDSEDGAGLASVLLYYQVNNGSWTSINITNTQKHTFTAAELVYGQVYNWYIVYNDTVGNDGQTPMQTFSVSDKYAPVCRFLTQVSSNPEYDESNTVIADFFEPDDASGISSVILFYRVQDMPWQNVSITDTQRFSFDSSLLAYAQVWEWYFWVNDTAGNVNQTNVMTFTVQDITPPNYSKLTQSNKVVTEGENNTVSIVAFEPADASGIVEVHLYYSFDNNTWMMIDVTNKRSFTFDTAHLSHNTCYWFFWLFDACGNQVRTPINSFQIISKEKKPGLDLSFIAAAGVFSLLISGSAFAVNQKLSKNKKRIKLPKASTVAKWGILSIVIGSVIAAAL
ncbi:MAG: hypothetical protein ACFFCQ_06165, partial [Promethearchaeota archaeon]